MNAARALRTARLRAGLTQRELAAVTGVPQPAIARIESAGVVPRVDTLDRLLRGCGTTLEITRRLGDGISRDEITRLLNIEPEERLGLLEHEARLRAGDALAVLVTLDAQFVVVGGVAERLLGSPAITDDLDISPARTKANLRRLTAALEQMGGAPPASLAGPGRVTIATTFGAVDCIGVPAGSDGYAALHRAGSWITFGPGRVRVASIDDLILMRRSSGRSRDLLSLEILGALRDEIDESAGKN